MTNAAGHNLDGIEGPTGRPCRSMICRAFSPRDHSRVAIEILGSDGQNGRRRHLSRVVSGGSVVIMAVSVVVIAVLFVRLMMTNGTTNSGTRHTMMPRHMAKHSADYCSSDASSGGSGGRDHRGQDKHSAKN